MTAPWSTDVSEDSALQVTCPTCGAAKGEWCTGPRGGNTLTLHVVRASAARVHEGGRAAGEHLVVARLEQMHFSPSGKEGEPCQACDKPWPCPTLIIAAGAADVTHQKNGSMTGALYGGPMDGEVRGIALDEEVLQCNPIGSYRRQRRQADGALLYDRHGNVRYGWAQ